MVMAIRKEKYDGRSRPTNQAYEESWNRIFGVKSNNGVKKHGHVYQESCDNKKDKNEKQKT
tara:strand:+ start:130 stop:312 length:183 start_codon:yes stop_codon:yes gene_type:complete